MTTAKSSPIRRLLTVYCAIGAGILFVLATGLITGVGNWYSSDLSYRNQTDAFLRGHVALAETPTVLLHDHCWVNGRMQQVWGLGIPVWRLPFEALSHLCGFHDFPDRLTFAFAYGATALLVFYVFSRVQTSGQSASLKLAKFIPVVLLMLFPPFVTLCRTRFAVYEEALAYGYLYDISLFCGLLLFAGRRSLFLYFVLALFSGLGPFVRPTLVFGGGATIALAALLAWNWRFRRREIAAGLIVFVAGISLLFLTNWQRFGSPLEFGHSLNFSDARIRYATRIENPYRHEPILSAARELWGALFEVREFTHDFDWYQPDLYRGQSPSPRWREAYFSTYDLSFAGLIAVAWIIGARSLVIAVRQRRQLTLFELSTVWSIMPILPLLVFYLHSPFITSRYMFDFGPAFAIALVGLVFHLTQFQKRWANLVVCCSLMVWMALEIAIAKIEPWHMAPPRDAEYVTAHAATRAQEQSGVVLPLPGDYRLDKETDPRFVLPRGNDQWTGRNGKAEPKVFLRGEEPPSRSLEVYGIPHNGNGWDLSSGTTEPMVTVFVDAPAEVTVEVVPVEGIDVPECYYDSIRAKIGLEELNRKTITNAPPGKRIVFYGPRKAQYQAGIQALFLSMMPPEDLGRKRFSDLRLTRITWRKLAVEGAEAK